MTEDIIQVTVTRMGMLLGVLRVVMPRRPDPRQANQDRPVQHQKNVLLCRRRRIMGMRLLHAPPAAPSASKLVCSREIGI